jgi:transposase-like protein
MYFSSNGWYLQLKRVQGFSYDFWMNSTPYHYPQYRYPVEIIIHAVWLYFRSTSTSGIASSHA